MTIPTDEQFFSREDPTKPDHAFLKNHFYREGRLSEEQALYILEKATEILRAEPNLLYVDAPVTGACCPLTRHPDQPPLTLSLRMQCVAISTVNMCALMSVSSIMSAY